MTQGTCRIRFLKAENTNNYCDEVEKDKELLALIHSDYEWKKDYVIGLDKADVAAYYDQLRDADLKEAFQNINLIGESRSVPTTDHTIGSVIRKGFVAYVQKANGKYDVLVVYGKQKKKFDYKNFWIHVLAISCLGLGIMSISNFWVGLQVMMFCFLICAIKCFYQKFKPMQDHLYGLIRKQLVEDKILNVRPDGDVELILT